jgi:hypothetical protein
VELRSALQSRLSGRIASRVGESDTRPASASASGSLFVYLLRHQLGKHVGCGLGSGKHTLCCACAMATGTGQGHCDGRSCATNTALARRKCAMAVQSGFSFDTLTSTPSHSCLVTWQSPALLAYIALTALSCVFPLAQRKALDQPQPVATHHPYTLFVLLKIFNTPPLTAAFPNQQQCLVRALIRPDGKLPRLFCSILVSVNRLAPPAAFLPGGAALPTANKRRWLGPANDLLDARQTCSEHALSIACTPGCVWGAAPRFHATMPSASWRLEPQPLPKTILTLLCNISRGNHF